MKNYKHAYPFTLATTSFIYRDSYLANAEKLAPYIDEIELLIFESTDIPSESEIEALKKLSEQSDLSYNVHLPFDISLTDDNPENRISAARKLYDVISLCSRLSPSTYTLHLSYRETSRDDAAIRYWQEKAEHGVSQLLSYGVNSRSISIETLEYPFEWTKSIIDRFDFAVCLDIGHLLKYGFDVRAMFARHASRTTIFHLHGVHNGKDHLALDMLSQNHLEIVSEVLKKFKGVVSLEVFSEENLLRSSAFLEKTWSEITAIHGM